jgi:hypothetical protein
VAINFNALIMPSFTLTIVWCLRGVALKANGKRVVGVFIVFLSLFGFTHVLLPVTEGQQDSLIVDREYWLRLANNAWKYFQPGVGVDSVTGLHNAGLGYPYFTDWDLGVYIQAIIDANQLGILSSEGSWGVDARLNKILSFLQTRQLSSVGLPYVWYQSADGKPYVTEVQNAADTGELLVALNNLRTFRPDLVGTINSIVFNRTNYAPLQQAVNSLENSKNLYDYYVASGFAGFWPSQFSNLASSILNNIVSAPTVSTNGVALPISKLTCEPLLLSVFNLAPNVKLDELALRVYLAHEARYNATGKFVAFSEGNTGLDNPGYVYEWIVKQDGSTWTIDNIEGDKAGIVPIIFFKVSVGLLAMQDTAFTNSMALYVESKLPTPSNGYSDGIDENGRLSRFEIDKTNSMVIGAALYAINNLQSPTPTLTPTPTPSTPTSTLTPIPDPSSPTASPTPGTLTSPTPSPSNSADPTLSQQLETWFVTGFIAFIIVFGCSRIVMLIIGYKKEKTTKTEFYLDYNAIFKSTAD